MSLWAFQSIAHGADGMVHFRWRTARKGAEEYWYGILDHDNIPRARFQEFKREGEQINRIGAEILGSALLSDIAVIKDYDAEWVFDHQFLTKEVNLGSEFQNFFQAASEMKHNIDFVGTHSDFGRYKIIFGPHLILMDPVLAGKIKQFVTEGGTFVLSAHSAVKDRDNGMTDQTIPILVRELFGVEVENFQCYPAPSRDKNALLFQDGQNDSHPSFCRCTQADRGNHDCYLGPGLSQRDIRLHRKQGGKRKSRLLRFFLQFGFRTLPHRKVCTEIMA